MDPLSRVLELLTVAGSVSSRLEAGGNWALAFPGVVHVKFGAIHRGEAWMRVGSDGPWQHLRTGDCFVLTTGDGYAVASEPGLDPVDGLPAFRGATAGVARIGTSHIDIAEEVVMTGARFVLDESSAPLLLDVLPPLLVVGAAQDHATALRLALELFALETAQPRLGGALVTGRLAQVAFVEALRAAVDAGSEGLRGWLAALADERIGTALHLMHADPAHRWTVPELARTVHMSRSGFAERFRSLVGAPPLDHLLRMRMLIAGRELRRSTATVSAVGTTAGYTSDAAFSTAFKRVMGRSPSGWRALAESPVPTSDETDAAVGTGGR